MKLLFVCQHYWPEPFNITDVCETLVNRGHDVTVLTGLPNTGLPNNEIPDEYKNDKTLRNQNRNGVNIVRVWQHPRKSGAKNRILNYLSFWLSSKREIMKLDGDFDVVVGFQFSPILMVDAASKWAKKHHKPFLLYCFDLWPESLVAGGFSKDSVPFKIMKSISTRIYNSADQIAVTSPMFFTYLNDELNVDCQNGFYLPQYAEDIFNADVTSSLDKDMFPPEFCHLMFAGNVGAAQAVETIIEAANIIKDEAIKFHIVGNGVSLQACINLANKYGLDNVVFHGRHELDEMPLYYSMADAMVATLAGSPLIGYTLPRKVQTYMAAAKPILGTLEGEGSRVIKEAKCGLCCDIGNPEAFANICMAYAALSDDEQSIMAKNARLYYEENFNKDKFFSVFENNLIALKETFDDRK